MGHCAQNYIAFVVVVCLTLPQLDKALAEFHAAVKATPHGPVTQQDHIAVILLLTYEGFLSKLCFCVIHIYIHFIIFRVKE
jgi:hypothetical protein